MYCPNFFLHFWERKTFITSRVISTEIPYFICDGWNEFIRNLHNFKLQIIEKERTCAVCLKAGGKQLHGHSCFFKCPLSAHLDLNQLGTVLRELNPVVLHTGRSLPTSPYDYLNFRHRASCILGQAFHYSPENAFYIFNQQIYFIIWYLLDRASLI